MAFLKDDDRSFDFSENPKAAVFTRSLTLQNHSPKPPLSPCEFTKKPHLLERIGSVKKLSYSPFDSTASSGRGKVKKLCSIFEKPQQQAFPSSSASLPASPKPSRFVNAGSSLALSSSFAPRLPGTEDRVVIYFTSLRGIRRTHADCCAVRMIFKGFRVNLDERDISMDSAYKRELQCVIGEKVVSLPHVFIKGKYIGGAEVVRQLNEAGELTKMLSGLPIRASKPGLGYICEGCGDARFVPCLNCNGSRKVFDEDDQQLKRCPACNENGLVRCPGCCY